MTNQIENYHLKIAFIWTKSSLTLFGDHVPVSLFPFPVSIEDVKQKIKELYLPSSALPVTLPWKCERKGDKRNAFWRYYLKSDPVMGYTITNIANRCIARIVPFHRGMSRDVDVSWPTEPANTRNIVSFEGYLYRHGVSLVATANIFGCRNIEELVDRARQFRFDPLFSLHGNQAASLTTVAGGLLNQLAEMTGMQDVHDYRMFSVSAFDVEQNDQVNNLLPTGQELQRFLEAVTGLSNSWKTDILPELTLKSIPVKKQQTEDILYGTEFARAIWLPRLFTRTGKKNYALRWYFRNLLISTMHVSSLICFKKTFGNCTGNTFLRDHLDRIDKEIELFKKKSDERYQSMSISKLITDNGL
ncbi:MAG: hypothetical protein HGA97_10655 [Chlorobiaceae bacterium]|nr:hypothetical protein [Chlorobiaceae bacterium]